MPKTKSFKNYLKYNWRIVKYYYKKNIIRNIKKLKKQFLSIKIVAGFLRIAENKKKYIKKFKDWLAPIKRVRHYFKIKKLRKKYASKERKPNTLFRAFLLIIFALLSWFLLDGWGLFAGLEVKLSENSQAIFNFYSIIITAPVLFIIWVFRDANRLRELENQRKDTNLAEFQQLQQWATGNIVDTNTSIKLKDGAEKTTNTYENKINEDEKIALQISALHQLRGYLKGYYGEDFRRGAYEIFTATLTSTHNKILDEYQKLKPEKKAKEDTIAKLIEQNPLAKQLNRIVAEEYFNLLINHNYPTTTISLVGVNLSGKYLRHKDFSKKLDLSYANLQSANLSEAQLQRADLSHANLQSMQNYKGRGCLMQNYKGRICLGQNYKGWICLMHNYKGRVCLMHNYKGRIWEVQNYKGRICVVQNYKGRI